MRSIVVTVSTVAILLAGCASMPNEARYRKENLAKPTQAERDAVLSLAKLYDAPRNPQEVAKLCGEVLWVSPLTGGSYAFIESVAHRRGGDIVANAEGGHWIAFAVGAREYRLMRASCVQTGPHFNAEIKSPLDR